MTHYGWIWVFGLAAFGGILALNNSANQIAGAPTAEEVRAKVEAIVSGRMTYSGQPGDPGLLSQEEVKRRWDERQAREGGGPKDKGASLNDPVRIPVSHLSDPPEITGDTGCVRRALTLPFRAEHYIVNRVEFFGSGGIDSATYHCAAADKNEQVRVRGARTKEGAAAVAKASGSAAAAIGGDENETIAAMRNCLGGRVSEDRWEWRRAGRLVVSCTVANGLLVGRLMRADHVDVVLAKSRGDFR